MLGIQDIFKIGIGPSSSHTVAPMYAAKKFINWLDKRLDSSDQVLSLKVELFASMAATGRGHQSDRAIIAGLLGFEASSIDIDYYRNLDLAQLILIKIGSHHSVQISLEDDFVWSPENKPQGHNNAVSFTVHLSSGKKLRQIYFPLGEVKYQQISHYVIIMVELRGCLIVFILQGSYYLSVSKKNIYCRIDAC